MMHNGDFYCFSKEKLSFDGKYKGVTVCRVNVYYPIFEEKNIFLKRINLHNKKTSLTFFEKAKETLYEKCSKLFDESDDRRKKYRFIPYEKSLDFSVISNQKRLIVIKYRFELSHNKTTLAQKNIVRKYRK